jgi:calcium-dependent protein kinase
MAYPGSVISADSNLLSEYEIGYVIGTGGFGTVRLARERKTGIYRALKSIPKARLVDDASVEAIRNEIALLHLLCPHDTIASLIDEFEDDAAIHLVFQLASGGDLFDRISVKRSFSEAEAARHFRRMVEMIEHCHVHGVVHLDLKPENFLLSDRTDDAVVLGCDFGLGTFFKEGEPLTNVVGTVYYVAPEVIRRGYGPQADVWSLGVVLFILLSGKRCTGHVMTIQIQPFMGKRPHDAWKRP